VRTASLSGFRVLVVLLLVGIAALVPFSVPDAHAAAGDGFIQRYRVGIQINADGSLDVTEAIDYTFTDQSHGIFRNIPNRYPVDLAFAPKKGNSEIDETYDRVIRIEDFSVSSPSGAPTAVQRTQEGNQLVYRVGDPDRTISGPQSYLLTYHVVGALNSFDDQDELYWNAIGADWLVDIKQARVSVSAPAVTKARCFAGPPGVTNKCDTLTVTDNSVVGASAALPSGSALTIVVAMPKGAVTVPPPIYEQRWSLQRAFSVNASTVGLGVLALLLGVLGVAGFVYRRGRDRRYVGEIPGLAPVAGSVGTEEIRPWGESGEGPVEWSPPDGLRPGLVGTLIDEQANVLDVTATIVDLAVRGYLRIDELPRKGIFGSRDWQLVQLKGGDDTLLGYEAKLFAELFKGRNTVRLSELKRTFATDLAAVQGKLYDEMVYRKWYRRRPDSTRTAWGVIGFFAIAAAIGITYLLARYTTFGIVGLAIVLSALALWWSSRYMPARTGAGSAVLARALGFRRYLATAEASQIRFEEGVDIFSRYLPYAIVFGEADRWAKVFEDLAAAQGTSMTGVPWYTGPVGWTYRDFGSSVAAFSVSTSGSISAAAASSSSGFSGGGSSGGGMGGGGGGGW
jgi:Predicted membrane protein (DUF2207) C-terminal domain/Predicted membrane protein (DUF2207) N-terminal domain